MHLHAQLENKYQERKKEPRKNRDRSENWFKRLDRPTKQPPQDAARQNTGGQDKRQGLPIEQSWTGLVVFLYLNLRFLLGLRP